MKTKILVATALGAGVLFLSACGADPTSPGTGTSGAPSSSVDAGGGGGGGGSADRDGCLIGTWQVDVQDLATQGAAKLGVAGTTGTGGGTLTVGFGDELTLTYDNSLTITMPLGGSGMELEAEFDGVASSNDWTAKDGKIDGTFQSNTVTQSSKATVDGRTVPMPSMPMQGMMDFNGGNIGYTCAGSSAEVIGPGITWKLTKA